MRLRTILWIAALIVGGNAATSAALECDRPCLRAVVTQYLDAFVAHQPTAVFAPNFKYIEDTIETKARDGFWKQATKLRPYRFDILDVRQSLAGTMTIVEVDGAPAMVAAIAKVVDRRVTQLETLIAHNVKEGVLFDIENLLFKHPAVLSTAIVGYPDPRLGERACAFVVLRPGQTLDLSDVRFIDSSGLGLMVRAKKLASQRGLNLAFRGLQPAVRNVVHVARLETFLHSQQLPASRSASQRSSAPNKILEADNDRVTTSLLYASRGGILPEPVTNPEFAASNE